MGIGHHGAEDCQDDEPKPVQRPVRNRDGALFDQEKGACEEAGSEHFVKGNDVVVRLFDVEAIDDGKDGRKKGGEDRDQKAVAVFEFAAASFCKPTNESGSILLPSLASLSPVTSRIILR